MNFEVFNVFTYAAESPQTRKLKNFKVCTHQITITTMSHRWGALKFQNLYTPQQRVYTPIHTGALKKVKVSMFYSAEATPIHEEL